MAVRSFDGWKLQLNEPKFKESTDDVQEKKKASPQQKAPRPQYQLTKVTHQTFHFSNMHSGNWAPIDRLEDASLDISASRMLATYATKRTRPVMAYLEAKFTAGVSLFCSFAK